MLTLSKPAFIMAPIRSGSTLLRCLLNSHAEIYAPHELHLSLLKVTSTSENSPYLNLSLNHLGFKKVDLKFLLLDRIYHLLLVQNGKRIIIDKSPSNIKIWKHIHKTWPQSKYIFLKRDPAAIARSIVEAEDGRDEQLAVYTVANMIKDLLLAESTLKNSITVKYEELIERPEFVLSMICSFLGIRYSANMLHYKIDPQNDSVYGIGDWSKKIKEGKIVEANFSRIDPKKWPLLQKACREWGYDY